jgi:hypothetical protein
MVRRDSVFLLVTLVWCFHSGFGVIMRQQNLLMGLPQIIGDLLQAGIITTAESVAAGRAPILVAEAQQDGVAEVVAGYTIGGRSGVASTHGNTFLSGRGIIANLAV